MGDRSGKYRDRNRSDDRRPSSDIPRFTGRDDSRVGDREFTFEHPRQPPKDSYRPSNTDRAPPSGPRRSGRGGGGARGRGGGGGGGGGGSSYGRGSRDGKPFVFQPPVPAHERPILYFDTRGKTPELMEGMASGSGDRFREEPEEMDGAGEGGEGEEKGDGVKEGDKDTVMEISDDEDAEGDAQKVDAEKEEKSEKKPDVISMIRAFKAKPTVQPRNAVAENDDFIPFSFGDESEVIEVSESEPEPEREEGRKMRRANDGHRIVEHHGRDKNRPDTEESPKGFSHRDHHYNRMEEKTVADVGPPGTTGARPSAAALPPPPALGSTIKFDLEEKAQEITMKGQSKPQDGSTTSFTTKGADMPWPPPPPPMGDLPPPPPPPRSTLPHLDIPRKRKYAEMNEKRAQRVDGNVKPEFVVRVGDRVDPTPWVTQGGDHSRCLDLSDWLHKEITDFVSYIQPRAYEHAVRRELIHRVRRIITTMWPDTDVRVFGSFAAELYLPTSDVDLVVVSQSFAKYDIPKYSSQKALRSVADALKTAKMASYTEGLQVIAKAKVPIVKFIDHATGLHVDISFENSSGLVANETFQRWKTAYPAMPILLLLIKHFVSMRGLNEVYHGGIGSFSITCLVISMLQLLPSVRSGRIDPRLHLGVMLLEFLELYGKNFNTNVVGIRVDDESPGYFRKAGVFSPGVVAKPDQLAIQDPNDPTNDISKSSFSMGLILSCFSDAYDALVRQMTILDSLPFEERVGRSILGVIIGGNYRSIDIQREAMRKVYIARIGPLENAEKGAKDWEQEQPRGVALTEKEKEERDGYGAPKGAPKGPKGMVGKKDRPRGGRKKNSRVAAKAGGGGGGGYKGKRNDREVIVID